MNKEKEEEARLQEIAKKKGEILEVFHFYYPLFKRGTGTAPELILGNVKKALESGLVTHEDLGITVTQFDLLFSTVSSELCALKNLLIEKSSHELDVVEKYKIRNLEINLDKETVEKIHRIYGVLFPTINQDQISEMKNLFMMEVFLKNPETMSPEH